LKTLLNHKEIQGGKKRYRENLILKFLKISPLID